MRIFQIDRPSADSWFYPYPRYIAFATYHYEDGTDLLTLKALMKYHSINSTTANDHFFLCILYNNEPFLLDREGYSNRFYRILIIFLFLRIFSIWYTKENFTGYPELQIRNPRSKYFLLLRCRVYRISKWFCCNRNFRSARLYKRNLECALQVSPNTVADWICQKLKSVL